MPAACQSSPKASTASIYIKSLALCGENASGLVENPSTEEPDARMGHDRLCGSRWRVTVRGYLANQENPVYTRLLTTCSHRRSHPFERLLPSFSARSGTEMHLYPIESFVYHHARQMFVSQMIAQCRFFVCIETQFNTLTKLT